MSCSLFLAFSAAAAWGQQDVFGSIRTAFQRTLEPAVMVSIASALVLLIGFFVVYEIRKSDSRQRARAKIGWDKFFATAAERGLAAPEVTRLEALVAQAGILNAEAVFVSATIFENVLDSYYQRHGGVHTLEANELAMLRILRDRVGFGQIPVETPYVSTRQFRVSDRILLELPELQKSGSSMIENMEERWWAVTSPLPHDISAGSSIRLSLTRGGDAEYTMETKILKSERGLLYLEHTRNLNRKQLRNWVRIDVSIPCKTRVVDAPGAQPGDLFAGRILDLSGGGISVRLPLKFPVGSRFTLEFDLPEAHLKGVEVQVARVSGSPSGVDEMYQHSMSFLNLAKPLQEKIVHFVFEKQRQDAQWR